jgi:hypothetical protein
MLHKYGILFVPYEISIVCELETGKITQKRFMTKMKRTKNYFLAST